MSNEQSIHPGVQGGRRRFEKVNTCANSSQRERLTRQLAGIQKHLETNPRDGLSQRRVATIKSLVGAA